MHLSYISSFEIAEKWFQNYILKNLTSISYFFQTLALSIVKNWILDFGYKEVDDIQNKSMLKSLHLFRLNKTININNNVVLAAMCPSNNNQMKQIFSAILAEAKK